VGLDNYTRALHDRKFWVSFGFTLKYTLIITPILIIGGYLLALLTSAATRLRRVTRTVLFTPVVIGLGVSSLLWYWLFSTDFGLVNAALQDLGVVAEPIVLARCRRRPLQPRDHRLGGLGRSSASHGAVHRRHPGDTDRGHRGLADRRRLGLAPGHEDRAAADPAHGACW
jgi:hypothetical protein